MRIIEPIPNNRFKGYFCFLFFFTTTLSATTINIPADYSTIQAGIDASTNGDTVLVQTGTYVENFAFNWTRKALCKKQTAFVSWQVVSLPVPLGSEATVSVTNCGGLQPSVKE